MSNQNILPASAAESTSATEIPPGTIPSGFVARSEADRRRFTWRTIAHSMVSPRRKAVKRANDRKNHYVDFHPLATPFLCVGIIALAAIDAVLTLYFHELGVNQSNGVVLSLLNAGSGLYIAAKLIVTCICTLLMVAVSNVRVFGIPARYFLYVAFFGYFAVVANMLRFFM